MRKSKWLILLLLIALLITACGQGTDDGQEPKGLEGGVIEKEAFSVFVPKNWYVMPVTEDEPDRIQMHTHARDELSAMNRPGIQIIYYGPESSNYPPPRDFYDNVEDLESQTFGDLTWNGYSCELAGNPMLIMWVEGDGNPIFMQTAVWLELGGREIALEDEDVKAIFESISIK
ncbi:MAG: hypothetical protein ACOX4E_03040 [Anaerovoracaceae bacterium]